MANLVAFIAKRHNVEEVDEALIKAKAQIRVIDQELDMQASRVSQKLRPPTKKQIRQVLRGHRKMLKKDIPRANAVLKALLGKVEMVPNKTTGRADYYTARAKINLGELVVPRISSYGSGERI